MNKKNSKPSSVESSPLRDNPLSVLELQTIASDLLQRADDPAFVRSQAERLNEIAEEAFDVLAFIGSNVEQFETQSA